MESLISRMEFLLVSTINALENLPEEELLFKPSPDKWSKKEILGHLIDSAINNLQRFTEITFEDKPYRIRNYKQDELVKANNYQKAALPDLVMLWFFLNNRIISLIKNQSASTLQYQVIIDDNEIKTLDWLIRDYVAHLEHHLKQFDFKQQENSQKAKYSL